MSWNHNHYPFDSWNKDQDLNTAIQNYKTLLIGTSNVLESISKNYTYDQLAQIMVIKFGKL